MKSVFMSKRLLLILGAILVMALLVACPAEEPAPPPEEEPGLEEPIDDVEDPAEEGVEDEEMEEEALADPELIARGEEVVQQNCLMCHGQDLQGMGNAPGLLHAGQQFTTEELYDILVNGIGAMPGGTARGEEEAVIAYLLTLE